jgi:Domain of unknown function (DUF3786)
MAEKSAVFETTYQNYLCQLAAIDFLSRAERLGADVVEESLVIPLYGTPYTISRDGVRDARGSQANFAISVVLCCYLLQCPETVPPAGDWMTYREFRNAGPLVGYFTANTQKIIETAFAGNADGLMDACHGLGGQAFEDGASYDVSLTVEFLPRIPVLLRFNDKDSEFPAQCAILFPQSAETFLDMECMAIGGTLLAGTLMQFLHHPD